MLGVAAGAFGAHALRAVLEPPSLAVYDTGVRYGLVHALAIVATGLAAPLGRLRWLRVAAWAFLAGTLLFSGSLAALAFGAGRPWAYATPLGGVAFLIGWLALAGAMLRR